MWLRAILRMALAALLGSGCTSTDSLVLKHPTTGAPLAHTRYVLDSVEASLRVNGVLHENKNGISVFEGVTDASGRTVAFKTEPPNKAAYVGRVVGEGPYSVRFVIRHESRDPHPGVPYVVVLHSDKVCYEGVSDENGRTARYKSPTKGGTATVLFMRPEYLKRENRRPKQCEGFKFVPFF